MQPSIGAEAYTAVFSPAFISILFIYLFFTSIKGLEVERKSNNRDLMYNSIAFLWRVDQINLCFFLKNTVFFMVAFH